MSKSLKIPAMGTKRLSTVLIASAGAILLAGCGGLYLLQSHQAEANQAVADREKQVGTNEMIAKRYQTTLDTYNVNMEQIKYLEPSMSQESFVPTLIQQLQEITNSDHLKLNSVRPGPVLEPAAVSAAEGAKKAAPPSYKTMTLGISVDGTYAQIMTFVYDLTRFKKIISVQSVSFAPKSGTGPDAPMGRAPLLASEISLTAYVFDDAGQPGAPVPAQQSGAVTNTSYTAYNSNPIAAAAGRAVGVARADFKIANVHDRTQGLLEPAAPDHPNQGGTRQ